MRSLPRSPLDAIEPWFERIQAWLLLFPSAVMLWFGPRAPLAGDPNPELAGAALAVHLMIPALAWALPRRAVPRVPWVAPLALFIALGTLSRFLHPPSDTLEADRALLLSLASVCAVLCGATLHASGRVALVRASVVLSLLALLPALLDPRLRFGGVFGNSGATAEVAVIGASAGVWLLARESGAWRWIGGATALAHAIYCGLAPALTGAVVLCLVLLVTFAFARERRVVLAAFLVGACALFAAVRLATTRAGASSTAPVARDTGGLEVRKLIAERALVLIGDHALLGVGPGQFAAAFPPYRDPRELELTTHGRTLRGVETEVEHAHNDVLQAFADAGIAGGICWLAFAAALLWKSWRALRGRDDNDGALAVIAIAVLANACAREPLLWNPASAIVACAAFGALLGKPATAPRVLDRRMLAIGAPLALLLTQMPRVLSIEAHASLFARYVARGERADLDLALRARSDSADARELAARDEARADDPDAPRRTIAAWKRVLELRPHRFAALMQLGTACARAGRFDEARTAWTHASALDPNHPGLAFNFALLEAQNGSLDEAQRWLERSQTSRYDAFAAWGVTALRELDLERGWALLERADERFAELGPERAYELAKSFTDELTTSVAAALEGSAHVAWARQHAEAQRFGDAVRSYRQAKRGLTLDSAKDAPPRWSPALHLELAAALALDQRLDDARRELDGVAHGSREWTRLPNWAGEALLRAGLLAR